MTLDQLKWLLQAVDSRPITNLDEADHKAECLKQLAQEIREALAPATTAAE